MPFRTMLFAPGNHARKVEKVFDAGADAVILDLEDAVAISEKPATRAVVRDALQRPRSCLGYARVNGIETPFCYGDIEALIGPGIDGIVLPKAETADQLKTVDWLMGQLERDRGLPVGSIDLLPIIETAKGHRALSQLASAVSRVKRLSFGAGDYTLDLGMRWSLGEAELIAARAAVVMESRAAELEPPIDTVFIHLNEEAAFQTSAEYGRDTGFQGKLCIHPKQIEPANMVFTPSDAEVAYAKRVVAAFDEAEAAGSASIQVEGYFVDYPIVEKARRTLALAIAIGG
ncbi:MAG: HpcH/HpaI aldolase/citrate lyase family protein [Alphaproteobacteria bacterium]